MIRIAFDIGGVLSKWPQLITLLRALAVSPSVEVFVVSDMHPVAKIVDVLERNGILLSTAHVVAADYATHGEHCKAVVCRDLGIDILIDDFIGYLVGVDCPPIRLLVMPDPNRDYYHPDWQTDGSEGNFGRRTPPGSKRPPEDRGRTPL